MIEIRKKGKYELELVQERIDQTVQEQVQVALELERHKMRTTELTFKHDTLVDVYHKKSIVYMALLNINATGEKVVKIGSTDNISERSKTHRANFGDFYIFEVIEAQANASFEQFLHKHSMIRPFRHEEYKYFDKGAKKERTSNEVYLVQEATLKQIISIAKRNVHKFLGKMDTDAIIEHEKEQILHTREQHDIVETEYKTVLTQKATLEAEIKHKILVPEVTERIIYVQDHRKAKVMSGPKIQIYDVATSELKHTFQSLLDATRTCDHIVGNASKPMIANAIKNKIAYKGYIWLNMDREKPDDTIQELPEVDTSKKSVNIGLITMLDLSKKVLDVFPDMKSASAARLFKNLAAISKAINKGTQSSGHYWSMWDALPQDVRAKYLETNQLPQKARRVNGIVLEQRDPVTNEIVKTFTCIEEVVRDFGVSRKSLKEAIEGEHLCKGYKWTCV